MPLKQLICISDKNSNNNPNLQISVSDPYHFDFDPDPDPRIRIRDDGSEVTFDSVNRIFPFMLCKVIIYKPAFRDPYHLVGSGSVSGNVDMDPGSAKN